MPDSPQAFITGISGQDGSYLAEFLLAKGYTVHGLVRRSSGVVRERLEYLYPEFKDRRLFLHYGDLSDGSSLWRLLDEVRPTEIYNLGAQSHVKISFDIPEYTVEVIALGTLRLLEWLRSRKGTARFYQASSSEMFGSTPLVPQREDTPFHPRSPYGCAKVCAHELAVNYRESYGLFVCCGILFNHESPRRGANFVTRKITRGVAAILSGRAKRLPLGNLAAKRDWGFAGDYVAAMWRMLQQEKAEDYVIATGETHSVQEFVEEAFGLAGLDWRQYVVSDPRYLRPAEVDHLCGDAGKARTKLGWQPTVTFKELVALMLKADCAEFGVSLK